MRSALTIFALVFAMLAGCGRGSGTTPYTNRTYGFTVDYPAAWEVNKAQIAPPPPAGTSFSGNSVTIEITVWQAPSNANEQVSLRQEGWMEENISVAGQTALSFTRPTSDSRTGVWRQVYLENKGFAYELTLNVYDEKQGKGAHKVFDDFLQSMRWEKAGR